MISTNYQLFIRIINEEHIITNIQNIMVVMPSKIKVMSCSLGGVWCGWSVVWVECSVGGV